MRRQFFTEFLAASGVMKWTKDIEELKNEDFCRSLANHQLIPVCLVSIGINVPSVETMPCKLSGLTSVSLFAPLPCGFMQFGD